MKEKVDIAFENGQLEGVFQGAGNQSGVILTHPHPEYGGNMDNVVVRTMEQAYLDNGYATLRFNFRGTGKSTGDYNTFFDLCADVTAATSFLKAQGISNLAVAGYSFGSWVNAHTVFKKTAPLHQLLVSPPVSFMDFTDVSGFSHPCFVICGDRDEYAHASELKGHLKRWNIRAFKEISGCDHFYSGMDKFLYASVVQCIDHHG
ncbi:hypothetical protein SAMN02746065_10889 [Desulfocicer vacuolatum DSM 3385]|uniref:Serine aminopeptidase S33 domain-containing protein n=1 Tax=Desulfocicer vacuolatum DSM 3385 TaxID=1121400 RepID=A0A1W2BHI6_9BACT|nr:alpha/beta hydrolase [Desulfocicer vacuolatum]SMC72220.1 hypothetical protein SAMN02746065_10889 [Desulfocicer vacuolatum DSM 3385]